MTAEIRDCDIAPALVPTATTPQKPQITTENTPAGGVTIVQVTPDAVRLLGGSDEPEFNALVLIQTLLCAQAPVGGGADARLAAVTAALGAFKPKDEIEGMLGAQATALHFGAMECFRRAMILEQPFEIASKLRKDGVNLARGMTEMLDALDRRRGKARPQVVRVERVIVNDGGQAVVGAVAAAVGGGVG